MVGHCTVPVDMNNRRKITDSKFLAEIDFSNIGLINQLFLKSHILHLPSKKDWAALIEKGWGTWCVLGRTSIIS